MPYPFAHPAAILPLARPLGRFAAPSALVIGSMIPDFWYFLPLLKREDSHDLAGLVTFCLPAGLLAYVVFHLLLKQPLLALLPEPVAARLAPFAFPALPRARWPAVLVSLLAGALTHLAWDALTHDSYEVNGFQVVQHASTLLGTGILAWWIWQRLRRSPAHALPPALTLSPAARRASVAFLIVMSLGWAGWVSGADPVSLPRDAVELRRALRSAGVDVVQALALSMIGYAMLWKVLR